MKKLSISLLLVLIFQMNSQSQNILKTDGVYCSENTNTNIIKYIRIQKDKNVIAGQFEINEHVNSKTIGDFANEINGKILEYVLEKKNILIYKKNKLEFEGTVLKNDEILIGERSRSGIGEKQLYKFIPAEFKNQIKYIDEHIYKVVEKMPIMNCCRSIEDQNIKHLCHEIEIYRIIYRNLNTKEYDTELEGVHVVSFVVEKNGSLSDIKSARSLSNGHDNAIVSALESINKEGLWYPGIYKNQNKRVRYVLPIKFHGLSLDNIVDKEIPEVYENDESFLESLESTIKVNNKKFKIDKFIEKYSDCRISTNTSEYFWIKGNKRKINIKTFCQ